MIKYQQHKNYFWYLEDKLSKKENRELTQAMKGEIKKDMSFIFDAMKDFAKLHVKTAIDKVSKHVTECCDGAELSNTDLYEVSIKTCYPIKNIK